MRDLFLIAAGGLVGFVLARATADPVPAAQPPPAAAREAPPKQPKGMSFGDGTFVIPAGQCPDGRCPTSMGPPMGPTPFQQFPPYSLPPAQAPT
jgi:hypothetical protein